MQAVVDLQASVPTQHWPLHAVLSLHGVVVPLTLPSTQSIQVPSVGQVGVDDGTLEGPFDGMLLGDADGRDDRRVLGDTDGMLDGAVEGDALGIEEGASDSSAAFGGTNANDNTMF